MIQINAGPYLDVIHEMCSISFNLFIARDSTENNLRESLTWKHPEADATNGSPILHQGQSFVFGIKDQSGDVFLRHSGQLVREDIL